MEDNVKLFLSVPHTGTTSLLELFRGDKNLQVVEMHDLWVAQENDKDIHSLISRSRTTVIHSHLELRLMDLIDSFIAFSYTVATMRDPLLSIITGRQLKREFTNRGNECYLIDQFVELATMYYHEDVDLVLPIDLMANKNIVSRMDMVNQLSFVEVPLIHEWVTRWTEYKPSGDSPLKSLYRLGQDPDVRPRVVHEFIRHLPKEWQRLQETKHILKPFMEGLGYQNLLWW